MAVICDTRYTCRDIAPHSFSFAFKRYFVVCVYKVLKLVIVTVVNYQV